MTSEDLLKQYPDLAASSAAPVFLGILNALAAARLARGGRYSEARSHLALVLGAISSADPALAGAKEFLRLVLRQDAVDRSDLAHLVTALGESKA